MGSTLGDQPSTTPPSQLAASSSRVDGSGVAEGVGCRLADGSAATLALALSAAESTGRAVDVGVAFGGSKLDGAATDGTHPTRAARRKRLATRRPGPGIGETLACPPGGAISCSRCTRVGSAALRLGPHRPNDADRR